MPIGASEVGLLREVTSITKLRLRLNKQELRFLRVMRTVAVQTTDVVAGVRGRRKMLLLVGIPVTLEAALARLVCG
jgi:hypothetical protein